MDKKQGQLTIAGCGLHPGHMTLETVSTIQAADVVLVVGPNPLSIRHIQTLNPRVENLGRFYNQDLRRDQIYQCMADEMCAKVREGLNVCTVFYGHPGVFALSPHLAYLRLENEGYPVRMLPGISADACLFADLDLDPATSGCASYESTQFLLTERAVDTGAALILWQVGLVGEHTLRTAKPGEHGLAALTRLLREHYPAEHKICIYEAPTMPGFSARKDWLKLQDLPGAALQSWSTLFVPPARDQVAASERFAWLGLTEQAFSHG